MDNFIRLDWLVFPCSSTMSNRYVGAQGWVLIDPPCVTLVTFGPKILAGTSKARTRTSAELANTRGRDSCKCASFAVIRVREVDFSVDCGPSGEHQGLGRWLVCPASPVSSLSPISAMN